MAEYIKREDVMNIRPVTSISTGPGKYKLNKDMVDFLDIIRKLPAADVVEVVRCKDCRAFMKHPTKEDTMCCSEWPSLSIVEPNDYCSYGERRRT